MLWILNLFSCLLVYTLKAFLYDGIHISAWATKICFDPETYCSTVPNHYNDYVHRNQGVAVN